jgi:uncharacterized membrane protein
MTTMMHRTQRTENKPATTPQTQLVPAYVDKPFSERTRRRFFQRHAEPPRNIDDVERILSFALGSAMAVYGVTRRSWTGALIATAGAALMYRGATGRSRMYRRVGIERPNGPISISRTITIDRPREEVYSFWRTLENLPRFMPYLRSVQTIDKTRSHWTAVLPTTKKTVEWDSEIVEDRPSELIRWRTLSGARIKHNGEVRFVIAPGGRGTEVHVHMQYQPPIGAVLGALIYPIGKEVTAEELRRLKRLLESGEIPRNRGVSRERAHDGGAS